MSDTRAHSVPGRVWIPVGLAAQAAILLLPSLFFDGVAAALADPAVSAFLLLASAFCYADLTRGMGGEPVRDEVRLRGRSADGLASFAGTAVLAIFWAALAEHLSDHGRDPFGAAGQFAGLLCLTLGIFVRHAAIRALGRYFVTELRVSVGQPLLRKGVFRFVRHPSELGLLAIALGAGLWLGGTWALTLFAVGLLPAVVARIRRENEFLRAAYGVEFEQWAARTANLVPGLW